MKKSLIALILVLFGSTLYAQKIGFHLSPNLTKYIYPVSSAPKTSLGLGVRSGVSFEQNILKRNQIETGLFLRRLKFRLINDPDQSGVTDLKKVIGKTSYLELPINIKTRLRKESSKLNIHLITGYSFNLSFHDSVKLTFDSGEPIKESRSYFGNNIHSFNLGMEFKQKLDDHLSISLSPTYLPNFGSSSFWHFSNTLRLDFKLTYALRK